MSAEVENFSLPEQRHRVVAMPGGRGRTHIVRYSTFKSSKNPGRWTRRAADRRALCGALHATVLGVDAAEWGTDPRADLDAATVDCTRCLERGRK